MQIEPLTLGEHAPHALCCTGSPSLAEALDWVRAQREALEQRTFEYGATLFRGFPLVTDQDFDAFIRAFGLPNFSYRDSFSNAVRTNRTERVFTANEAPPEVTIFLHHEMAQTPVYPSKLFFFCEQAAETGGATPICRSDKLMKLLQEQAPDFARDCEQKGLRYRNVMPAVDDPGSGMGRSWQSTFSVEAHEGAEARLQELGYEWHWLDDGSLQTITPVLQGVRVLPDGRKTFFNQLIAAAKGWKDTRNDPDRAITFGDGSPIEPADIERAVQLAEEVTFDLSWQTGDVALVDNYVAMHGRRTFSGTRKVLASLVAA